MYNFDEIINRAGTNSVSQEGWKRIKFSSVDEAAFDYPPEEMIRMWVADMEFATPPPILDAIRARLDQRLLGYSQIYDPAYYSTLVRWFATRHGWEIDPDTVVSTPGIVPALNRLVPMLVGRDERILICTPSYAPFQRAGDLHNREVLTSKLVRQGNRFIMDMADLEAKITNPAHRVKVFILCNPHNPTGRAWSDDELRHLGELCFKHDVWIISDEVHCDLLRIGVQHTPLMRIFPHESRIIACISPSKTFNLAGNLLAHLVIKEPAVRRAWLRQYGEVLSPLSIAAVQAAYGDCGPWLDDMRRYLDDSFRLFETLLATRLPLARFAIPEATYLAWVDLSAYARKLAAGQDFATLFATKAGVLVEDQSSFVRDGEGYVRMNLACPQSLIKTAVARIDRVLAAEGMH